MSDKYISFNDTKISRKKRDSVAGFTRIEYRGRPILNEDRWRRYIEEAIMRDASLEIGGEFYTQGTASF